MTRCCRYIAATALAAALWSNASRVDAEPVRIWNSWVVPVSNIASIFSAKNGITKHEGQSYVMDALRFQGSTAMIAALNRGDIDIALLGYSSLPRAIEDNGMEDLRVIADEIQDGVPGHYSQAFLVRRDGPITRIEDLKGQAIATNGVGSAVDIAMRAMLMRHGVDPAKDVTWVAAPFSNMRALLRASQVALMPSVLPYAEKPEMKAETRPLFTQRDAMGRSELGLWVARNSFIGAHRAALVDLLEDYLRVVRFYTDPRHHAEAVKVAAAVTQLPEAALDPWLFTKRDYYRDRRGRPDLKVLQANIDLERREGFLRSALTIRNYVDLSLVAEAAGRLRGADPATK